MEIRTVSNGFIINRNGQESIAKTLLEAAEIVGEYTPPTRQYTRYREDKTKYDLSQVVAAANRGHKIDAIKALRNCFEPPLGLLEAKEIVEVLLGK